MTHTYLIDSENRRQEIGGLAFPAMAQHGLSFVSGTTWNVGRQEFGVLPEIYGLWGIYVDTPMLRPVAD